MRFSTKTVHSLDFYRRVLMGLITGLAAGLSQAAIANNFNEAGLLTPTGNPWQPHHVKEACKKLRHPQEYPSRLNTALLELIVANQLTVEEAAVLRQQRTM